MDILRCEQKVNRRRSISSARSLLFPQMGFSACGYLVLFTLGFFVVQIFACSGAKLATAMDGSHAAQPSAAARARSETPALAATTAPFPAVQVNNLALPGAFEIQVGKEPISLATQAYIEKQSESEWVTATAHMALVEECKTASPSSCIDLAAGARLRPVRWVGYSCSGQCDRSCKKNLYLGPGVFRLAILSCDKKTRYWGAPFQLPAAPP
jgi:hypothetical protein